MDITTININVYNTIIIVLITNLVNSFLHLRQPKMKIFKDFFQGEDLQNLVSVFTCGQEKQKIFFCTFKC